MWSKRQHCFPPPKIVHDGCMFNVGGSGGSEGTGDGLVQQGVGGSSRRGLTEHVGDNNPDLKIAQLVGEPIADYDVPSDCGRR